MPITKADLRITSITPVSGKFIVGDEVDFEIMIKNIGTDSSSSYNVVVYDEQGNPIDSDPESPLDENRTNPAHVSVRMNKQGSYGLKFVIEGGESAVNSVYRKFTWYELEKIHLEVQGIENGSIRSKYDASIGTYDDDDYGIGIKFDFDELPRNAIIKKAVLKLDPNLKSPSAGEKEIGVYRIESYRGWSSVRPEYFDKDECHGEGTIRRSSWYNGTDIDITDLVRKWHTDEYNNYGMYIFDKEGIHISGSRSRSGYYVFEDSRSIELEITYLGEWEQVSIHPYDPACGYLKIDNSTYPLHVPFKTKTSNPDNFIHGDGWNDIESPETEADYDINWWAVIGGLEPVSSVDLNVTSTRGVKIANGLACFSFAMGLIHSAMANTSAIYLRAYKQRKGSNKRALLIYDTNALSVQNFAGKSFRFLEEIKSQVGNNGILDPNFETLYQEWLKFTYDLPDVKGRKYDIKFTFDSGHKNDPGVGFIYKNKNNEILLKPFRLQGDIIEVIYTDRGSWSRYKELKNISYLMETPLKLKGITKDSVEKLLTRLNATIIKPI